MSINGQKEFELLNKIGFIRVSGSEEELKAAHILKEEIESYGLEATIDPFPVDEAIIHHVKLEVLEPYYKEYDACAYKCCGNASLEGELVYVDNGESHSLVIGATGSGKTTMVINPLVNFLAKKGESMVITDPKGEIFEKNGEMGRKGLQNNPFNSKL